MLKSFGWFDYNLKQNLFLLGMLMLDYLLLLTSSVCGLFFNNFSRGKNAALAMNGQANSPKLGICFLGLEDKSIKWTSPGSLSQLGHYHLWGRQE